MNKSNLIFIASLLFFSSCNMITSDLESRVQKIEDAIFSPNEYIKTKTILNIRKSNDLKSDVIAIASENTFLRLISSEEESKLYHVEFYIDNFPFLGYVSASPAYTDRQNISLNDELKINKSGFIKFNWEEQIVKKVKSSGFNTIGINVEADSGVKSILENNISNMLLNNGIKVKQIDTYDDLFIMNQKNVKLLLSIKITNKSNIQIKLYSDDESLLMTYLLPFNSSVFEL